MRTSGIIIHLSVGACVPVYEREVTGSRLTRAKNFLFLGTAELGRYNRQPIALAPATTKVSCFKRSAGHNYIKVHLLIPWSCESDIMESMLSTGGFHKETILF